MAPRAPIFAFAALVCAAPLAAHGADAPKAERILTYAVDVAVVGERQTPAGAPPPAQPVVMVKGRPMGGRTTTVSGSGDSRNAAKLTAAGTITVEVVQHTEADFGLVVDLSEDATQRSHPKVRVAVASDGALYFDPTKAADLSEEELAVARWLGRGFYGDHPTDVGTTWTVDQSANGHTDLERYTVTAHAEPLVTLSYALEEHGSGATGYAGTRTGSLVYDLGLVVPVKAAYESVARRQVGSSSDTLRTSVKLTLTADSFAHARAR